jgi:predicted nucleic acid-binding protein
MGQRYLIDSNVLIDYAANLLPEKGSQFVQQVISGEFLISVVIKIEVLGFAGAPLKMKALEEFLNAATVIGIDQAVTQQTIALRRLSTKLKLPDAIIAATAIVYDLTLITHNTNDFKTIPNLKITDPHIG